MAEDRFLVSNELSADDIRALRADQIVRVFFVHDEPEPLEGYPEFLLAEVLPQWDGGACPSDSVWGSSIHDSKRVLGLTAERNLRNPRYTVTRTPVQSGRRTSVLYVVCVPTPDQRAPELRERHSLPPGHWQCDFCGKVEQAPASSGRGTISFATPGSLPILQCMDCEAVRCAECWKPLRDDPGACACLKCGSVVFSPEIRQSSPSDPCCSTRRKWWQLWK